MKWAPVFGHVRFEKKSECKNSGKLAIRNFPNYTKNFLRGGGQLQFDEWPRYKRHAGFGGDLHRGRHINAGPKIDKYFNLHSNYVENSLV